MNVLENWLNGSYEDRHVKIELTCTSPSYDDGSTPEFTYAVTLSEFAYSGPSEPASTGDHSSSIVRHTGWGADLEEATAQAYTQFLAHDRYMAETS